jgi:hypothetical protein
MTRRKSAGNLDMQAGAQERAEKQQQMKFRFEWRRNRFWRLSD